MNAKDIKKRLAAIEARKGDDESAHGMEDALVWDFVKDIGEHDHGDWGRLARLILKSQKIDFSRWCA